MTFKELLNRLFCQYFFPDNFFFIFWVFLVIQMRGYNILFFLFFFLALYLFVFKIPEMLLTVVLSKEHAPLQDNIICFSLLHGVCLRCLRVQVWGDVILPGIYEASVTCHII